MKWFWISLAVIFACGTAFATERLVNAMLADMRHAAGEPRAREAPYSVRLAGEELKRAIAEELANVNAQRAAEAQDGPVKSVLLEVVQYERSAGAVIARGRLRDMGEGRRLTVVLDAYGADGKYLGSRGEDVTTVSRQSVPFAVALNDSDQMERFGVRALHESAQVELIDQQGLVELAAEAGERAVLLDDDQVLPSDYAELVERLRSLGYAENDWYPTADLDMTAMVNRFREDHGLERSNIVDVRAAIAIRLVTPSVRPERRMSF